MSDNSLPEDQARTARVIRADQIPVADPYPANVDPYPPSDSYSCKAGLQVFDLVTPDGDRVWVVAGWEVDTGKLRAWTIKDFTGDHRPCKSIPDDPRRFAPLTRVNAEARLREDFFRDYASLNHGDGSEQQFNFGLCEPPDSEGWIGRKVYPYQGREHIVRDYDTWLRLLNIEDRDGELVSVDIWEVTASWHTAHESRRTRRSVEKSTPIGQYLYRLYNKGGALLYVGITDNVFRRWNQHSKDKQWWPEVHNFTQDWFPDRQSVEAAERRAIATEGPKYNVIHASSRKVDA